MDVFFATRELADRLGSERRRVKEFGADGARRIDLRLQQLCCAPTLDDVRSLPGRCRQLNGNLRGHLTIDVQRPLRLVFKPYASGTANRGAGAIAWRTVEAIIITDIIDEP